jgi:acyl-CoA dehydrogenase
MSETQTFRHATREWLETNCPREMREPVRDDDDVCWGGRNPVFKSSAQRVWLERMAGRGWTAPDCRIARINGY